MLAKKHRLRTSADFDNVYRNGKALRAADFRVHTCENGLAVSRFGIVVANKSVPNAVARNRVKRRIRGVLREIAPNVRAGYDIVIVVTNRGLKDTERAQLHAAVEAALTKIGFLER